MKWQYHSGMLGKKMAERIYCREDGLWARVYTRQRASGEWGKGKVKYSWSPDFKNAFLIEPKALKLIEQMEAQEK